MESGKISRPSSIQCFGKPHSSDKFAVPLDLKAEQRPGAPTRYGPDIPPDYTMTGGLSGKIVRGNLELAICDNENVMRRKLKDRYGRVRNKPLCDLCGQASAIRTFADSKFHLPITG